MVQRTAQALAELYRHDETAWLEHTAAIIRAGQWNDLDPHTLAEFLDDMAKRDRREVYSRLVVLLTHLLKWDYQPEQRSASWRGTIREQRRELRQLLDSGTLRQHAQAVYAAAYNDARAQAADETGLALSQFPTQNPWDWATAINDPDSTASGDSK